MITDVILYTERQDNIGEVARKIVGKQHSLELNPDTLKYKINRDINGQFRNLQFLDGEFVGLSVLGDNERPAFGGSHFFANNEDFQSTVESCRQNFDRFLTFLNENGGEIEIMEFSLNHFLTKVAEAAELTMQEFQRKIWQWLDNNGILGYLIENTDNYAIVEVCEQGEPKCYKYQIAASEEELELHNPVEVKYTWTEVAVEQEIFAEQSPDEEEDKPEEDKSIDQPSEQPTAVEGEDEEEKTVAQAEDPKAPEDPDDEEDSDAEKEAFVEDSVVAAEEGVPNATEIQEVQERAQIDEMGETTTSVGATSFTDSERLELEEFRRQAKIAAINEYRGDVEESVLAQYITDINDYTIEQLQNELNRIFRENIKKQIVSDSTDNSMAVTAFQIISRGTETNYNENNPADVIHKYKK